MTGLYLSVRVLHVLFGVFWAGAVFFSALFLDPAVREAGPEGGKVMGVLQRRGWMRAALTMGTLTVVTGVYLLWVMSGRFSPGFMGSRPGILLSTGMLAGILTLGIGMGLSMPTAKKVGALSAKLASAAGAPSAEDLAELARLRGRMTLLLRTVAVLLAVAVVTMALGPHM
ncbi:MAG: hypothetical protein AMXMBFR53_12210 [Gemmatimonadota bacterium]